MMMEAAGLSEISVHTWLCDWCQSSKDSCILHCLENLTLKYWKKTLWTGTSDWHVWFLIFSMCKHSLHLLCLYFYVPLYLHMWTYIYCYCLQSAQNRLLIKNGKVVNEDGMADNDVYVEDGIIKWVLFYHGLSVVTEAL